MNKPCRKAGEAVKRWIYWLAGVVAGALAIAFSEGTIIAATKAFGVTRATLIRICFTIPASWLVIYLATKAGASLRFTRWLAEREESLSTRAKLAVEGGKWFVVLNTVILLGPVVASVLMLMIGFKGKSIYVYAALGALLSAWVWALFYSGMLWGVYEVICLTRG